jgi:dihydroneopterin aldolase
VTGEGFDSIVITGLRAFAHHGVLDQERADGQEFIVDVTLWLDLAAASKTDDLKHTVHYGELAEDAVSAVERDPVDLIETVAERVLGVLLERELVRGARVTVHKPSAPISVPFDDVAVTRTRWRQ